MYSRQEISLIRKNFWTRFGQYMKPIVAANGDTVNWLNYKTGIKHLYFRMDADNKEAAIAIEIAHPDSNVQQQYFEQLQQLKNILVDSTGEQWQWKLHDTDDNGNTTSYIRFKQKNVNVLNESDWPKIISFLKPRIIALDNFWDMVKDGFE